MPNDNSGPELTPYQRGQLRAIRRLSNDPDKRAVASKMLGETEPDVAPDQYPALQRRTSGTTYRET